MLDVFCAKKGTAGIAHMTCSIDGASPETYRAYRVHGNFDAVIENIAKINRLKKAHQSNFPRLHWQFIVFGHLVAQRTSLRAYLMAA